MFAFIRERIAALREYRALRERVLDAIEHASAIVPAGGRIRVDVPLRRPRPGVRRQLEKILLSLPSPAHARTYEDAGPVEIHPYRDAFCSRIEVPGGLVVLTFEASNPEDAA